MLHKRRFSAESVILAFLKKIFKRVFWDILFNLGVKSITVVLMFLKADVVYDANLINASEIATAIEDLGFDTQVLDDTANNNEKVNLLVILY